MQKLTFILFIMLSCVVNSFAAQPIPVENEFKIQKINAIDQSEFEGIWQVTNSPETNYSLHVTNSYVAGFIVNVDTFTINYISGFIVPGEFIYFFALTGFDQFEAIMIYDTPLHATMTITTCVQNGTTCDYEGATLDFIKVF